MISIPPEAWGHKASCGLPFCQPCLRCQVDVELWLVARPWEPDPEDLSHLEMLIAHDLGLDVGDGPLTYCTHAEAKAVADELTKQRPDILWFARSSNEIERATEWWRHAVVQE